MPQLKSLREATCLSDLAALLDYTPKGLAYVLYKLPESDKYQEFEIPKSSGGSRLIHAPCDRLKLLQRRTADLLQNCLQHLAEQKGRQDRFVHGFHRGDHRSIITNASAHRSHRFVLNLDLHDFFGSINFGRVRGLLIKDKDFSLHPAVATILAQIACYKNALPQGSPCSPVLSNLVARSLDLRLVACAKRYGFWYTRYADDLTLSTGLKTIPRSIALEDPNQGTHAWRLGSSILKTVKESGFSVNDKKTRMQYRRARQVVTGLVVNSRVNVRREYRLEIRAMVHNLLTKGSYYHKREDSPGTLDELQGRLGFIHAVDLAHFDNVKTESKDLRQQEKLYRSFLIYREFYAADLPVILCEGKTDNVYIELALRSLASSFPALAAASGTEKIKPKVRVYKTDGKRTSKLMGLTGGAPSLRKFLELYLRETRNFVKTTLHPLIVVIDNDSGAKSIFSLIKQHEPPSSKLVDGSAPYYHLRPNVFVVPIPKIGGEDTEIEHLFPAGLLKTKLNGKSLNLAKDCDTGIHYGKWDFAQLVVKPKAKEINFDGFKPLLRVIEDIILLSTTPEATAEEMSAS